MSTKPAHASADRPYDSHDADNTLRGMLRDFYNRSMLWIVILVWIDGLIFMGGAIFAGIRFFRTDDTRDQIMYAAIFLGCLQMLALLKIFAWQLIHRNNIKRAIRRLETRIEQLCGTSPGSTP